ncbi:MAG: DUF302 domain-containing protein [Flavobacteriales bacterium]|nr:DUF302 domain-containing protein [Flavobacteriales bacterium]
MGYYFNKIVNNLSFDEALNKIEKELVNEDFDVVSKVDFKNTFSEKLNVDFLDYTVLGACNAKLAHEAVSAEVLLGLMLPCNVLVKRIDENSIEVAIVDPAASLSIFENDEVQSIAIKLQEKLVSVINNI